MEISVFTKSEKKEKKLTFTWGEDSVVWLLLYKKRNTDKGNSFTPSWVEWSQREKCLRWISKRSSLMAEPVVIHSWSAPRSLSTTLMYSFAQVPFSYFTARFSRKMEEKPISLVMMKKTDSDFDCCFMIEFLWKSKFVFDPSLGLIESKKKRSKFCLNFSSSLQNIYVSPRFKCSESKLITFESLWNLLWCELLLEMMRWF